MSLFGIIAVLVGIVLVHRERIRLMEKLQAIE